MDQATPKKYVKCPHDYPFLGKVDFRLTPRLIGRTKYYKGHLDHLGMHGFILEGKDSTNEDAREHMATFALMPVSKEVWKKTSAILCWGSFTKGTAL